MGDRGERRDRIDLIASLLLLVATTLYVTALPPHLGPSDEAYHLYHAKRLVQGQVLYRDVFDFLPPLFVDAFALLFRIAPMDIVTVRRAMAIVYGLTVVVLYRTCRVLSVGCVLSAITAMAFLALCQATWPYASPHWFGTFFTAVLLLLSLDRRRARRLAGVVLQGLVLGAMIATQHHKGVLMAAGLGLILLVDGLTDRRYGPRGGSSAGTRAVTLVATASAVVAPILLVHVALAGVWPVIQQLLVYPFSGYRRYNNSIPWGAVFIVSHRDAAYTSVTVLKYLPIVVPFGLLEGLPAWVAKREREHVEALGVLSVFSVCSTLSTLYDPDFIHLAFIAPVFLIFAATIADRVLARAGALGLPLRTVVAGVLLVSLGVHLQRNMARSWSDFPFLRATAFGRIAFQSRDEVTRFERIRDLVGRMPTREIFCYPGYPAMYLMTDTDNPTPHDLIMPTYQDEAELRSVIETLERRRVPIVFLVDWFIQEGDPVSAYVHRHYQCGADKLCIRDEMQ